MLIITNYVLVVEGQINGKTCKHNHCHNDTIRLNTTHTFEGKRHNQTNDTVTVTGRKFEGNEPTNTIACS